MRLSYRPVGYGQHVRVAIWINGGLAGDLCVRREEWPIVAEILKTGAKAGKHEIFRVTSPNEVEDDE